MDFYQRPKMTTLATQLANQWNPRLDQAYGKMYQKIAQQAKSTAEQNCDIFAAGYGIIIYDMRDGSCAKFENRQFQKITRREFFETLHEIEKSEGAFG